MIKRPAAKFAKLRTTGKRSGVKPSTRLVRAAGGVAELIRHKLASYAAIEHLVREWSVAVDTGATEYDRSQAKQFISLYDDWMKGTDVILKKIKALEARGQQVLSSREFRDAVGWCPAGIDLDESARTLERLERGEGVVVHEVYLNGRLPGRRAS